MLSTSVVQTMMLTQTTLIPISKTFHNLNWNLILWIMRKLNSLHHNFSSHAWWTSILILAHYFTHVSKWRAPTTGIIRTQGVKIALRSYITHLAWMLWECSLPGLVFFILLFYFHSIIITLTSYITETTIVIIVYWNYNVDFFLPQFQLAAHLAAHLS